jgi:hypothetical protein
MAHRTILPVLYPQSTSRDSSRKLGATGIACALARSSSNAPNGAAGLPSHITPTDGSWLNLIERWFELLTEHQNRRGSRRRQNFELQEYAVRTGFPPQPFETDVKDSKPNFLEPIHAPEGAPNVLLLLLDDAGFGVL